MEPQIHLALVDDWELRGDGSGDAVTLQLNPLKQLLEIYEGNGLRASINAEVMQQLGHRAHSARHAQLGRIADQWDEAVRDAVRRGHDVQLHTHSQWSDCEFDGDRWLLRGDWDITHYSAEHAFEIVAKSKAYLEQLVRQVRPGYSVRTFRSGSWAIAPSSHMLQNLVRNGIAVDISIVGGMRFANDKVAVDYTDVEEPFLPFYPDLEDARRLSRNREAIVCVPTFSFSVSTAFYAWLGLTHLATGVASRIGLDWTHLTRKPSSVSLDRRTAGYQIWAGPPMSPRSGSGAS